MLQKMQMKIEAYIIAWNRAETIAMTINHYKSFCSRVVLFDNYSDDGTRDMASLAGAEIQTFGTDGVLNDQAYLDVKNNCWKGSDADWVIVVDDDEILWHPNLVEELQFARDSGATLIHPQGWGVFSNDMPTKEWTEIMDGVEDNNYSKLCVFDPKALTEIGYIYGCHQARPKGRIRLVNKLFLLHYRAVGGVERLIERHHAYQPRKKKSAINERWGLGSHYDEADEQKRIWFKEQLEKSVPLSKAGYLF